MRLLLLIFIGLISIQVNAQLPTQQKVNPLIIIDTLTTDNETMIAHPSKFISITTMNPVRAVQMYGDNGKFGVIRIEAKPDIQWVRLNSILDKYNIEPRFRTLKICINRTPIVEPEKILADLNEIHSVEVVNPIQARDQGESFINIVTQPVSSR
jgi:hypothetical protein